MSQGTPFGRYLLQERLSSGPVVDLYRATTQAADGRQVQVLLKRIRDELAGEPAFANAFLDEAKVAASLEHPNIARVFEWGREGASLYLATEYIQGTNLGSALQATIEQGVRFQPTVGLHVLAEALQGLAHAHELTDPFGHPRGIAHRNLSPQAIALSAGGEVKLVDFGQALAARASAARQGQFAAGLTYLAPELHARAPGDHRADLFSAGAVLYEVLTGRKLHAPAGPEAARAVSSAVRAAPPSSVHADIPAELDRLVLQATSPDPAERPASARALRAALVELLAGWSQPVTREGLARYLVEVVSGRARDVSGRASFAFGEATSHWFAQGERLEAVVPGAGEEAPAREGLDLSQPESTDPVLRAPKGKFSAGSTVMAVEEGGLGRRRTWRALAIVLGVLALGGVLVAALLTSLSGGPEVKAVDAGLPEAPAEASFAGPVVLEVKPDVVAVFVDGDPVRPEGDPPALLGLRPGLHRVRLVAPGHLPWEGELTLVKDQPAAIVQVLEPRRGTLSVRSSPPKAVVWLDGKRIGKTPHEVRDLPADKEHALQLVLRGYAPLKERVRPADWPDDPAAPLVLERKLERPRPPRGKRLRGR